MATTSLATLRRALAGGLVGALLYGAVGLMPAPGGDEAMLSENIGVGWMLTPLYAIPAAIGLWSAGRLRWLGALLLVGVTTAAHYLAFNAAIWGYDQMDGAAGCVFGCSGPQQAEANASAALALLVAGAVGGAVGAGVSFAPLALLGPALRRPAVLIQALAATAALALIGGLGLRLNQDSDQAAPLVATLYLPWQLVFTGALALLLTSHAPAARLFFWQKPAVDGP